MCFGEAFIQEQKRIVVGAFAFVGELAAAVLVGGS